MCLKKQTKNDWQRAIMIDIFSKNHDSNNRTPNLFVR